MRRLLLAGLLLVVLFGSATFVFAQRITPTAPATAEITPEATPETVPVRPELLKVEVIATYPHDTDSYTQGLVLHDSFFYESAGMYGESDIRKVEPETGEVLQQTDLTEDYFGEGLALVEDRLIQITWKETTAFVYDLETFEPVKQFTYEGEGWGLCYDGTSLYMSDGSETLTVRDSETFEVTDEIKVTLEGQSAAEWAFQGVPLSEINELECVDDAIYANVYYTDIILKIDKASGAITGLIYAADLLTNAERAALNQGEVLNGIAYNAETETFYITGKRWPKLFEVRFVPAE